MTPLHTTTIRRKLKADRRFQAIVKVKGWDTFAGVGLSDLGQELS